MTKVSSKKASPVSDFQPSVATVEEQGILESFFKLPQTERGIIRQLLVENHGTGFSVEVHVFRAYSHGVLRTFVVRTPSPPNAVVFGVARSRGRSIYRSHPRSSQDSATKYQDLQNTEQQATKS